VPGNRPRRTPRLTTHPKILILTPVKNSAADIPRYLHNLHTLHYPHDKLTIGLLEGDSTDGSYEILSAALPQLAVDFHAAFLFKEDLGYQTALPRWAPSEQRRRRSAIALSRNSLLMRTLDEQDWVLWIDADVESFPADVLEHLLAAGKEIVVPHCVLPDGRTFDLNTFKLEPGAASYDWSPHLIDGILQPPLGWGRSYLSDFPDEELVELDSVGGTMLLVHADVHRHGALFPAAPYNYLLDTEGFASMAREMGYSCWGLPWLTIQHPAK
jgi:glycosyltransferase involved in cell wall biosynthesis